MKDLIHLNSFLEGFRKSETAAGASTRSICFIVGLPRVGSTLLHQVLISRYKLGYISNITGKFWKSPVAGAILHQSLIKEDYVSNFLSEDGNTVEPFEPCEYGWFWSHVLDINKEDETIGPNVNWPELNRIMSELAEVFRQPVIFDTPYACGSIASFAKNLDCIKVIYLTRNPWSVCNSILSARLKRYGDINRYYGAKPRSWHEIKEIEDPIWQVVRQVYDLKKEIEAELALLNPSDVFQVDVSTVRQQPAKVADDIASFLGVQQLG